MSPSKLIALPLAIFLDFIGIILFFFDFALIGIILSFFVDFFGFLIFGIWTLFKGQALFKTGLRFSLATLSELIPFWGDVFPTWTFFVLTTQE